ncbi:MAG TPA: hypothetical protein VK458_19995 [Myxococcaceae bacterium]|nr:hypothetical protein [Myxococcaceae bacterium]
MSYLDSPRIHFAGFFQADVSTINNDVRYYDNKGFQERYQELSLDGINGGWNPEGTGIFRFVSCQVTGARLGKQQLVTAAQDPVIGMSLENADRQAPGKLVDLDPQQQLVSQIWGMQARLTHGTERALFIGDLLPVGFMNLWRRQQKGLQTDQTLAANFQSVLQNVTWQGQSNSPVLQALREATEAGWLAIEFNLYGYGRDPAIPRYTLGRVVGTIGPYRQGEPKHFVMGRQMTAALKDSIMVPAHGVSSFQCQNHEEQQTLSADFGHCLQIEDADGGFVDLGTLSLGVLTSPVTTPLTQVAPDEVALLGTVGYQQPGWYTQTGGVQDFDYSAQPAVAAVIGRCPLVLLGPQSAGGTYPVLVQESLGGLHVRSDAHVCRLNPGERQDVDFYASLYGKPLATPVSVFTLPASASVMGGTGSGDEPLDPPVETPKVGIPPDAIQYPGELRTDASGHGTLTVTASAQGPGNPRGYIDGQLYGIAYRLPQLPAGYISNFWNFISVLAFDLTPMPQQPTWYADIQPLFKQYGNLYPIMSKHVVDLGDYDSVVKQLGILELAFSLPREDPNHMPVTRDLSESKRAVILKWLTTLGQDGLPLKGIPPRPAAPAPAPLPLVASAPEPAVALHPLQTDGKTAVILQYQARQDARRGES